MIRSTLDKPKVCSEEPYARKPLPLLIERLERCAQQTFVASLPVLQQFRDVVDGIHQVCQPVTLLGRKSATMTTVANEPRVDRCVFQYFQARR